MAKKKLSQAAVFFKAFFGNGNVRVHGGRRREIFTFLLFVALSFLFWVMQSLSEDMNTSYRIPIKYTNIPDDIIVTNDLPSTVTVHLRDEGAVLLNYNIEGIPAFEVDFRQYHTDHEFFILTSEQIKDQIKKRLKNTTNLTYISIDTLAVYYAQGVGKKVKVQVVGSVSTLPQCIQNGKITTDIDSVQIYAPERMLQTIDKVETDSFAVADLAATWKERVPLKKMNGVKMVPDEVVVTVPVEELTTKSFTVPIAVRNLPHDVSLLAFPAAVTIDCVIPMSRFSKLSERDVRVAVDYKETKNLPEKLAVKVIRAQGEVLRIVPDSVEYVIEKKR